MKRGFTLIELLLVLSLIMMITGIGMNAYSGARRSARDVKRKAELKTIQNSLEQYYTTCGLVYPTPNGSVYDSIICLSPSNAIMPIIPPDPQKIPYQCVGCSTNSYRLCSMLENEPLPAPGYCVSNQQ